MLFYGWLRSAQEIGGGFSHGQLRPAQESLGCLVLKKLCQEFCQLLKFVCIIQFVFCINKQQLPFGAKKCWDICPRTLSVPRSEQFSESYKEQIMSKDKNPTKHIFAPNGGYCDYYPSTLFRNTHSFEYWGIFSDIPQFYMLSCGIFGHVTC